MCGLVGFSRFAKGKANLDKLKFLIFTNYISRGKDATGIYFNSAGLYKNNKDAIEYLSTLAQYPEIQEKALNSSIIIAHVRAATVGNNTLENAHPFKFGDVIGAHNGTLNNWKDLIENLDKDVKDSITVDSMAIFARLNNDKNQSVLNEIIGSAAILFNNLQEPDSMYVYRNDERPLFKGTIDGEGLYFSSIENSLTMIGCSKVEEIKPHFLYKYTNGIYEKGWKIKESHSLLQNITSLNNLNLSELKGLILLNHQYNHYQAQSTEPILYRIEDIIKINNYTDFTVVNINTGVSSKVYSTNISVDSYNHFFKKGGFFAVAKDLFYLSDKEHKVPALRKDEIVQVKIPLKTRSLKGAHLSVSRLVEPFNNITVPFDSLIPLCTVAILKKYKDLPINANIKLSENKFNPEESVDLTESNLKSDLQEVLFNEIDLAKRIQIDDQVDFEFEARNQAEQSSWEKISNFLSEFKSKLEVISKSKKDSNTYNNLFESQIEDTIVDISNLEEEVFTLYEKHTTDPSNYEEWQED